mmetsp:Transcript_44142/g.107290  ORF Transcript_44142/g.107290 Transcript_44142/m.107290 type:complete len:103 (+) Transcript_44142:502-810(+)
MFNNNTPMRECSAHPSKNAADILRLDVIHLLMEACTRCAQPQTCLAPSEAISLALSSAGTSATTLKSDLSGCGPEGTSHASIETELLLIPCRFHGTGRAMRL